ncbi:MAG: polysaccharide biosynthesis protein [Clostridia bacterium]|nr:polysaccharide biosynthesis protein [Clostridia bacterium]MBR6634057.1 polysaccharide biosynthesis protein [Clostridia bacterium]
MRNSKLLILNTTVLTLSGFLMRTIAVSFNVYLTNRIGSAGIGLFQLIMSVYALAVTFASAGIRLGATRLVTDSLCKKEASTKKIVKLCIKYSLFTGCVIAGALFILSGLISEKWIMDKRAEYSLKILALSLPPVAVSAALNGYFTARKTLVKYSVVQLIEQLCRIGATVFGLAAAAGNGLSALCGAIAAGTTVSEVVSCILSCTLYIFDKKEKNSFTERGLLKRLMHISVPDAVGSGMRSVLLTVEHLLIPVGFRKSGQKTEEALSTYGTVHGMALPVILYPAAVLTALSGLLVPELSGFLALGQKEKINRISNECLKLTAMFAFGTGVFMFFFANKTALAVYGDTESAFYIKLLSVLLPVMYLDTVTDGLLKGLDQQLASMRYNIIDSGLCVALVYFLLPRFAVKGYIFILFLSEIINFALSFNRLTKTAELRLNLFSEIFKPLLAALGAGSLLNLIMYFVFPDISSKLALAMLTVLFVTLYFPCLYILGCVDKNDVIHLKPAIKR